MSRVWNVQLQMTTPEDLEIQEIEDQFLDLLEKRDWDENYIFANLENGEEDSNTGR